MVYKIRNPVATENSTTKRGGKITDEKPIMRHLRSAATKGGLLDVEMAN